jgi:MFS transporter, PHS family, inorganic phosphate transporter
VAASGFLASSWSLIATNIISPALYYLYPPGGRLRADAGLGLDEVTLMGTIIGMVVFGHLADRLGRKGLYGYELMIILTALGGVAFSSEGYIRPNDDGEGYTSSMDIYAAIFWWRCILGLGIGAEVC